MTKKKKEKKQKKKRINRKTNYKVTSSIIILELKYLIFIKKKI